ncbi:hypothetical protein LGZ99_08760 [Photorhabdus temperata]|uniref:hypothetical protein n=1 Tax=Photorhabdus temperata TaxID=574560 RepID=UPI0021D4BF7E|nr:hypothetical protein [Photorhabdus temperata]MCT8347295.1 hypothetical protein [Photorhabdus temperata]
MTEGTLVLKKTNNKKNKRHNYIRPELYIYEKDMTRKAYLKTTPGRDYMEHYYSMIRDHLSHSKNEFSVKLDYSQSEESKLIKELASELPKNNDADIIIIGDFTSLSSSLSRKKRVLVKICGINFSLEKYKNFDLLGIHFSFWGNLSYFLVELLLELGYKEIIYIGKLGCLTSESHLYNKIFSPNEFFIFDKDQMISRITLDKKELQSIFPEVCTGKHVSVPSVSEEIYYQKQIFDRIGINSIDNEISYMASAVHKHNLKTRKDCSFYSLHYATDYLPNATNMNEKFDFDLSNCSDEKAKERKSNVIENICDILIRYLDTKFSSDYWFFFYNIYT